MNQIELPVQKYLRSGKTLLQLKEEHGVNSFWRKDKIGLSYDQLEAKESDILSQHCRGLILRDKTFDIVAAPMFRFFNMDQGPYAAQIDWDSAEYEEKLDGTLIIAYSDENMNEWCIATRSCPEADRPIDGGAFTFTSLFEFTLNKMFNTSIQEYFKNIDKVKTYCFELTTPINRVICDYKDFKINLLAVKDNKSLVEELPSNYLPLFKLEKVKSYSFATISDLVKIVNEMNPSEHEGVVIKDKFFNRIKVKSPSYCAFNHLVHDKLKTSVRGCLELIILEKDDDVMHMLPEFVSDRVVMLKSTVQNLFKITENDWARLSQIEDKKEFALAAKDCTWSAALFHLKNNKIKNIKEFIHKDDELEIQKSKLDHLFSVCAKLNPELKKYEFESKPNN